MWIKQLLGRADLLIPTLTFKQVDGFHKDSKLLNDICKLRYEVYCLECAYLEAEAYPEHLETDEYEDYALHIGAYDAGGDLVGTVRLVQPKEDQPYPFESHCSAFPDFFPPPRACAGEISRLVVKPGNRAEQGRNDHLVLLGLLREILRHGERTGVHYIYAAMEDRLALSLEKLSLKFKAVGPPADYYGQVRLYYADLEVLNEKLRKRNGFLYAWFNDRPVPLTALLEFMLLRPWRKRLARWRTRLQGDPPLRTSHE